MKYKIIHQSWSTETLPAKYLKIKLTNKRFFKNWEYKLWTDEKNDLFIKEKFPTFFEIYKNYKHKINKIDAVRYFYLYEFGGVYMDLDITLDRDIKELIHKDKCCLFSQKAINDYFSIKGYTKYIDPMIMYSPPKNKFIKSLIDKLYENGIRGEDYNDVYDNMKVAGPAFLTDNYIKNNNVYLIENKIITKKNKEFYNDIYGIHLCDNTWV